MNETPKEARALLTAALRSGEYTQGSGKLRSVDDKFCCLGVACELYIKAGHELEAVKGNYGWNYGDEMGVLPATVQQWLGFKTKHGDFETAKRLTNLNDSGTTFPVIADIIDSEPEGLCHD